MKWQYVLIVISLFLTLGLWCMSETLRDTNTIQRRPVIDTNWKHPKDLRTYRSLTLANQLEVLLISDPNLNKSAAAMDVGIGSLEDPLENLGLAHFLEHMLFLGTEKYPDVEEYNRYLHSNKGSSNAFTSGENTNYHFEVSHEGFEGSLDRFAQFFISPTFDAKYIERERKAVHSEHQKNLLDDGWRARMLVRSLHKQGHPRQKFSTGDLTTLGGADREALIDFYRNHYSANLMKLVLMAPFNLDQLEAWAQKYFQAIPNTQKARPSYDSELFDPEELPRWIAIKPIKDIKKLTLIFATPSKEPYWQSKPGDLISHLLGYEGKGSLLSLLKQENLATGLSTWLESTSYAGTLQVDITLTEKGVQEAEKIIGHFFAYIRLLKEQGLPSYIFDERKIMADLNYIYRDPQEGAQVASNYASLMHEFPALEIDKREHLFYTHSPEDFQLFLSHVTPENLNAIISHKDVKTEQKEPYYSSEYKVSRMESHQIASWKQTALSPLLTLPELNPFIPHRLEVLTAPSSEEPYKLIANEWGTFWFQLDDRFQLPKANVQLLLLNKRVNASPLHKSLSLLYSLALNEGLSEWNYDISLAGLNYNVVVTDRGIQLNFSGYADNLPFLIRSLVQKLTVISIDEQRFEDLKNDLKRKLANARLEAAYQQLIYELKYLSSKSLIHRNDIFDLEKNIDLISPITLAQVKEHAQSLYQEIAIEGAAYGSLGAEELQEAIAAYYQELKPDTLPLEERPQQETIAYKKGQALANIVQSASNNFCWGANLQFGARDSRLNAAIRIGQAHLRTSFYGELRTNQQLGYVVHSGLHYDEKALGMLFLVQSSEYDPFEIAKRVEAWKSQALEELKAMDAQQFKLIQTAVASEMREKEKTMAEKHQSLIFEAIMMNGEFHYKEKIAKAAEALTQEEVIAIFKEAFTKNSEASLTVYLTNRPFEDTPTLREQLIEDVPKFKREAATY